MHNFYGDQTARMPVVNRANRVYREPAKARPVTGQVLMRFIFLAAVLVLGTGCQSVGPSVINRDRLHYASAVSDSWKQQLLLNIVKSRYGEAPVFLDVASVVSGYTVESRVSAAAEWQPTNPEDFLSVGATRIFTDRPTVSYSPMTGEKFARSLMSPVPLDALMYAVQGGGSIDSILGLTVQSFEGHHNMGSSGREFEPADAQYTRLIQLVGDLTRARALEAEIINQQDRSEVWLVFHPADTPTAPTAQQLTELKSLLGVPAGVDRARVVFASRAADPAVIGIRTRSLMQILSVLGASVRVFSEHLEDGSAVQVDPAHVPKDFTVYSGREKPDNTFVMVSYEEMWFWIDRRDFASKFTLAFVTMLFNFLEGGGKSSPVLTIPAN